MSSLQDALTELLRTRRTIRAFTAEPVPRATVEALIDAAVQAPSASNKQPWRFIATEDRARLDRLAAAVDRTAAVCAAHIPATLRPAWEAYGDYFTRFRAAPVVVCCLWKPLTVLSHLVDGACPAAERAAVAEMEDASGVVSASLAIENLLLAAHAAGLGASALTGPLIAPAAVREAFGIPDEWRPAALVALGRAAEVPPPRARRPAAKVLTWV